MSDARWESLLARDRAHVWHPYTQHGFGETPLPVRAGQGVWLELEDGRRVIDGISSWWVNLHGHGHPALVAAIAQQAARLEHVVFSGFTHEPGIELAELLLAATRARGARFEKVFYSDNGSTAVEVALKMAFQFHVNRGAPARTRFIALRRAYHGDTLGAMAVGADSVFHNPFRPLLPTVDFIEAGNLPALAELLERQRGQHAAMIVEPLVQGAEGMLFHSADYLKGVRQLCREHGVLLIYDEVFTGFYRTGRAFAFEHVAQGEEAWTPDLLCLSKGITGGCLPLGATLATGELFDAFVGNEMSSAFLHGHSFTANPIACAVAVASWRLLESPETQANIARVARVTRECLDSFAGDPRVENLRALGTIGALDIRDAPDYLARGETRMRMRRAALNEGVLLRPIGKTLYAVPPYCATDDELRTIYKAIGSLTRAWETMQ